MSKVILPKTTTAVRKEAIPAEGEVLFDKDEKQIFFGDGSTQGGIPLRKHSMQTAYVYGLDYDTTTNTTTGTKVVLNHDHDVQDDPLRYLAVAEFTQTPAHAFKSCLMDMATKQIKCFLDISDSTKKEDGTPLTEKEKKGIWTENGVDSLVEFMVRIPITWYREDTYHVTVGGVDHLHIVYLVSNELLPCSTSANSRPCCATPPAFPTNRPQTKRSSPLTLATFSVRSWATVRRPISTETSAEPSPEITTVSNRTPSSVGGRFL